MGKNLVLSIYPSDFRFGSKLRSADFERESSVRCSAEVTRTWVSFASDPSAA
jgi:hypothetical protein